MKLISTVTKVPIDQSTTKLAGAAGLEPAPYSLTVSRPTYWTTLQRNGAPGGIRTHVAGFVDQCLYSARLRVQIDSGVLTATPRSPFPCLSPHRQYMSRRR